ncbi:MAG: hypothetical protein QXU82_02235 [Candidatus Aenigmatarchaeota archaeon]
MFNIAMTRGGILVGRLTYALVGDNGYKVWINCDTKIAAERIANDKNRKEFGKPVAEIEACLPKRDMADIKTYERLYGISYFGLADKCDFFLNGNIDGKEKKVHMLIDVVVPWLKQKGYIK